MGKEKSAAIKKWDVQKLEKWWKLEIENNQKKENHLSRWEKFEEKKHRNTLWLYEFLTIWKYINIKDLSL